MAITLWLAACSSAPPPITSRPHDRTATGARKSPSRGAGDSIDDLSASLAEIRRRLEVYVDSSDVLDSLYFGWFDRPYAKAALAVAVKTMQSLQREALMRRRGRSAIPDASVRAMLAWLRTAPDRAMSADPFPDFRPHRLRVTAELLRSGDGAGPLYAFVDRATGTSLHARFGDLDLLASLGARVYARSARFLPDVSSENELGARAKALGICVVGVVGEPWAPQHEARVGTADLVVRPLTLDALLTEREPSDLAANEILALLDPPEGESWSGSLARRGLARGRSSDSRFFTYGWRPPGAGGHGAANDARITAAMWVHALEGQTVALIEGWRDLRDGSMSPYPSSFVDPVRIERLAHTALDVLRLRDHVSPYWTNSILAVVVDTDAVDPQDENAWADWIGPLWAALLDEQIRFDVIGAGFASDDAHARYPVLVSVHRDEVVPLESLMRRIKGRLSALPGFDTRLVAVDANGATGGGVFLRTAQSSNGRTCVALANLTERARSVRLRGEPKLGPLRDVINNSKVEDPRRGVRLGPWQVRLLESAR
ncbi:MAG: hypothetical protein IIB61_04590 [Planctomycetes bacterium]|nr:hypothetical protein [Planctomycetota bacterium]